MTIDDIRTVLIVGAGTMGQQIGLQAARFGYDVFLYDLDDETLEAAMRRIGGYVDRLTEADAIADPDAVLGRITPTKDLGAAARDADLVSESVPEDPGVKGRVFAELDRLCPPRTLFTTNTSTLLPSMFAEASGRPDQLVALHFHPDVWTSNVVDVMPHPGTAPEAVALAEAFARRIDQVPIVLEHEHSGYVFNTLLVALLGAAQSLLAGEVTAPENVDRAWMGITGMRTGPLAIMDHIGIDTVWKITHYWAEESGRPDMKRNAAFLKEHFVDRGKLGIKTGEGFYSYPNPAYAREGFVEGDGSRG
jgi:3-hydroxybutyryl-CoA dehydrogenase